MKLKLDENLGDIGRDILAADGHDVMSVREQGLGGSSDHALYDVCRDESRALITLDHDFGQVLRFPPDAGAGIAILECKGRATPSAIAARMADLTTMLRIETLTGRLWIVEPGRVRIHQERGD